MGSAGGSNRPCGSGSSDKISRFARLDRRGGTPTVMRAVARGAESAGLGGGANSAAEGRFQGGSDFLISINALGPALRDPGGIGIRATFRPGKVGRGGGAAREGFRCAWGDVARAIIEFDSSAQRLHAGANNDNSDN